MKKKENNTFNTKYNASWIYTPGIGGFNNTQWFFCPKCRAIKPIHTSEFPPLRSSKVRARIPMDWEILCISSEIEDNCRYIVFDQKRFLHTAPKVYIDREIRGL